MSGQERAGEPAPRAEDGAGWVPPGSVAETEPTEATEATERAGAAGAAGAAGTLGTAADPAALSATGGRVQRRSRKPVVLAALGILVVASLVGLGMVLAGQGDERGEEAGDEAAAEGEADDDASDAASETTEAPTTTTTTAPPEPEWQTVTGVDGEFRVELPGGWTYAALDDDATGVGAKLFPGKPSKQTYADGVAALIASTGPRLFASDGEVRSDGMPPCVGLERQPLDVGLDGAMQAFVDAYADIGIVGLPQGRLTGAFGEVGWIENPAAGRVDYVYVGGGETWKLAYVTAADNLADERSLADHIAQSLVITDAGTA